MTLIDGARRSIHIETYVLKTDETGNAILERLIARSKEGIEVRLLLDGFGSFHMQRRPLRKLRRAGGKVAFFLPIWRLTLLNRSNLRDHRKIAVFDGERVFAGGRNLADEYLGPKPNPKRWADFSFVLDGPAAEYYGEIFRYDWGFASHEKLTSADQPQNATRHGDAIMQVVPSGPDVSMNCLPAYSRSSSRQGIGSGSSVRTSYQMRCSRRRCRSLSKRGVDVRVVVPERSDQVLADWASERWWLREDGFEFPGARQLGNRPIRPRAAPTSKVRKTLDTTDRCAVRRMIPKRSSKIWPEI
jgi:cardiolipin synthase